MSNKIGFFFFLPSPSQISAHPSLSGVFFFSRMDAPRCTYTTSHLTVLYYLSVLLPCIFPPCPQLSSTFLNSFSFSTAHGRVLARIGSWTPLLSRHELCLSTSSSLQDRAAENVEESGTDLILRLLRSRWVGDLWDSIFSPSRNKVQFFPSPALFKQSLTLLWVFHLLFRSEEKGNS